MKQQQLQFGFGETPDHVGNERKPRPVFPDLTSAIKQTRNSIQRLRPPVKAHGGKYYLAKEISPTLLTAPGNPTEYLEPCAFGASVFLSLPRFEREILGDTIQYKGSLPHTAGLVKLAFAQ